MPFTITNTMKYFKLICIEGEIVIIADDAMEAGYIGMEISNQMNYTLMDVEPVKMSAKDYYPNKLDVLMDIDSDMFEDLPFDEFYEWRVCSHELVPGIHSVIRVTNKTTGKIREHAYKSRGHAVRKVKSLMKNPDVTFSVATDAGVVGYP